MLSVNPVPLQPWRLAFAAWLLVCPAGPAQESSPPVGEPAPARPPVAAQPTTGERAEAGDEERSLRREQLDVARSLFREHPSGDAAFALAMVLNEQGDLAAAIRQWQEGLDLPPESVRLHRRAEVLAEFGQALRIQEELDRAERAFRESLALQPRREPTLLRLAQLLQARDQAEECLVVLEAAPAKSAAAEALRGKACQRLGRLEDARRHFHAALALDPNLAEACYGLAVCCARLGAAAEAEEYRARFAKLQAAQQTFGREYRATLNPLHSTRESLAMTHTTVAWIYRDRGQPETAERLWRRAAEIDPANTACRFHLLMLYQQTGRDADALRVCEEMVRLEPNNPFHRISLGNLESRGGRMAEACRAYETAHRLGPDRAETCFALAQFYLRAGTNLPIAARLAAEAVRISPVAPHQFVLSRAAARTGDRATALAAIERACALDPANPNYAAWKRALASER